ncbi:MAG: stage III sporulation protein AA [Syntrophomonadaceae bacterium]
MKNSPASKGLKEVLAYLPPGLERILQYLDEPECRELEEIRLRIGRPLLLRINDRECTLDNKGRLHNELDRGYTVSEDDLRRTIACIMDNSLYAYEEDINRGFITMPGGHRVGLAGQVLAQGGEVRRVKDFSSLCIRLAREVLGCARPLFSLICPRPKEILNTLIISPPRCGKTTILRDVARFLSSGSSSWTGCNVALIDERSELAGCYQGIPQLNVGPRTDVLDGCPKHLGMGMALRALSPRVIITDELGSRQDVEAVRECVNAGVQVISTVHASSLEELQKRPMLNELLNLKVFSLAVFLSRRQGPGSLESFVRMNDYAD